MLIEEYDDEVETQPCPVCGDDDNEEVLMLCDGCDAAYHTYCVDLDSVPVGHWFCEDCQIQRVLEPAIGEPTRQQSRTHSHPRTRAQEQRLRDSNQVTRSSWARVWQSVFDGVNIDLDFPFGAENNRRSSENARRRTQELRDNQARDAQELRAWERRLRVAQQHGAADRFRDVAPVLLRSTRESPHPPEPESQEEISAWNALEKAKEIQADPTRKRKRKSATTSPSDAEPASEPQRPLKRPQTRRAQDLAGASHDIPTLSSASRRRSAARPSSSRTRTPPDANNNSNGPSFFQSLLKEVETSGPSEGSKAHSRPHGLSSLGAMDHSSPGLSSPGSSPSTSNHPSPRALSTTPPPLSSARPSSPIPLTSRVEPIYPHPEFFPDRSPPSDSPSSIHAPIATQHCKTHTLLSKRAIPERSSLISEEVSPNRLNMSLSAKSEIQKFVKDALRPHYSNKHISKDQYTDINRNVSRMLYDRIGSVGNFDEGGREGWEKLANEEVAQAVDSIHAGARA